MKYYKVKMEYDNRNIYEKIDGWPGHYDYKGFVVGGELITPAEMKKRGVPGKWCDVVEVSKKRVYWLFGVRTNY